MKTGSELIAEERLRQIDKEGWTSEHDDGEFHQQGELAIAGACYAFDYVGDAYNHEGAYQVAGDFWPWESKWFKETHNNPIKQLVKAGALIAAEIDRLQRRGIK